MRRPKSWTSVTSCHFASQSTCQHNHRGTCNLSIPASWCFSRAAIGPATCTCHACLAGSPGMPGISGSSVGARACCPTLLSSDLARCLNLPQTPSKSFDKASVQASIRELNRSMRPSTDHMPGTTYLWNSNSETLSPIHCRCRAGKQRSSNA